MRPHVTFTGFVFCVFPVIQVEAQPLKCYAEKQGKYFISKSMSFVKTVTKADISSKLTRQVHFENDQSIPYSTVN